MSINKSYVIHEAIYSVNAYVYILHNKTSEALTHLSQHICHYISRMYPKLYASTLKIVVVPWLYLSYVSIMLDWI